MAARESTYVPTRPLLERCFSIQPTMGMEGQFLPPDQFVGHTIAVFTSGGDSQGMNSAVRAVVRMSLYCGCRVFFIKEGYQGMVDGGDCIVEAGWADVAGIMQIGGTVIGSARCLDFREREGRLKAAYNLLTNGITNLVVVGGDGSLTGANKFREEWTGLLDELLQTGKINEDMKEEHSQLNIVGLVGSIDNDFCGTDMTIGTDSALHRIIEATDAIVTTAHSHQRCFIMEVMGRHCGYLALVAALAAEADFVFLPECPPEPGWEEKMCEKMARARALGQRVNIIMVAEGALDSECKSITVDYIKNLIVDRLKFDTRVTVLGHVQRGGAPSAFDRVLGIRMGVEAVLALMDANTLSDAPACVISLDGNNVVRVPLMDCVMKTHRIAEAMKNKDFALATKLRGRIFNNNLSTYVELSKCGDEPVASNNMTLGVINVGAPACGVNAAIRAFVRYGISRGFAIKAIKEGFRGLKRGAFHDLTWNSVRGWAGIGGSNIGARRTAPHEIGFEVVANKFREWNLSGLLIIGGFEGFVSLLELYEARKRYPEFRIPMILVPATISNNVPGTDMSLGADTSVNEITHIIDKIKQSAQGATRRVFVVETMGGYCGYLTTLSGLGGGADATYIYEEAFNLDDLRQDVEHLRAKMGFSVKRGLILRSETANVNYSTDFIFRLYMEESRGVFDCRMNILGHVQQGGVPSPYDRNSGSRMGAKAIIWLENQIKSMCDSRGIKIKEANDPHSAVIVGLICRETKYSPVIEFKNEVDYALRLPKEQWWMKLRPLLRIMSEHRALWSESRLSYG